MRRFGVLQVSSIKRGHLAKIPVVQRRTLGSEVIHKVQLAIKSSS